MDQVITESHQTDAVGNPAGGRTYGTGITIMWQDGPLGLKGENRDMPNGAFVEGVISAAIGRLEFYQHSRFRCRENALAITKLQEAMHWLQARTRDREDKGVEGTHGVRSAEGKLAEELDAKAEEMAAEGQTPHADAAAQAS